MAQVKTAASEIDGLTGGVHVCVCGGGGRGGGGGGDYNVGLDTRKYGTSKDSSTQSRLPYRGRPQCWFRYKKTLHK